MTSVPQDRQESSTSFSFTNMTSHPWSSAAYATMMGAKPPALSDPAFNDLSHIISTLGSKHEGLKQAYLSLNASRQNDASGDVGLSEEARSVLCGKSFEEALVTRLNEELTEVATLLMDSINERITAGDAETPADNKAIAATVESIISTLHAKLEEGIEQDWPIELSSQHVTDIPWAASIGERFRTALPHRWSRLLLARELPSLSGYPEVLTLQGVTPVTVDRSSWLLDENEEAVSPTDSVQRLTKSARASALKYLRGRANDLRQSLDQAELPK